MAALNTFRTDGEDFGEQILSKVVKAGRRTYFLDVRATRANDYFLTITESRKKTARYGSGRISATKPSISVPRP